VLHQAPAVMMVLSSTALVKLDGIMDFDTLVMTSTSSHLGDRENRVKEALKLDIAPLGRRLKGAGVQRKILF
jgi:hypothetical protein